MRQYLQDLWFRIRLEGFWRASGLERWLPVLPVMMAVWIVVCAFQAQQAYMARWVCPIYIDGPPCHMETVEVSAPKTLAEEIREDQQRRYAFKMQFKAKAEERRKK